MWPGRSYPGGEDDAGKMDQMPAVMTLYLIRSLFPSLMGLAAMSVIIVSLSHPDHPVGRMPQVHSHDNPVHGATLPCLLFVLVLGMNIPRQACSILTRQWPAVGPAVIVGMAHPPEAFGRSR